MKSRGEILSADRLTVKILGEDGGHALAYYPGAKRPLCIVFSWGGGWDHVSVSYSNRCPTWDEMCFVKKLFFHDDEVAIEYHPAESEYVNMHPYCLHIWKPQTAEVVIPPKWMVGI